MDAVALPYAAAYLYRSRLRHNSNCARPKCEPPFYMLDAWRPVSLDVFLHHPQCHERRVNTSLATILALIVACVRLDAPRVAALVALGRLHDGVAAHLSYLTFGP